MRSTRCRSRSGAVHAAPAPSGRSFSTDHTPSATPPIRPACSRSCSTESTPWLSRSRLRRPTVAGARTLEIDSTNTLLRTRNALAKIYRCLDPASGREAEILEGLAKLGTGGLPTVQALVRANELPSRPAIMLIQDWVPNADPAWEHFTAVLASGPDVDLSNEIRATAEATAAVHHGLAQLGSRPWEEADTPGIALSHPPTDRRSHDVGAPQRRAAAPR